MQTPMAFFFWPVKITAEARRGREESPE